MFAPICKGSKQCLLSHQVIAIAVCLRCTLRLSPKVKSTLPLHLLLLKKRVNFINSYNFFGDAPPDNTTHLSFFCNRPGYYFNVMSFASTSPSVSKKYFILPHILLPFKGKVNQ
jgi:hypothetical protein